MHHHFPTWSGASKLHPDSSSIPTVLQIYKLVQGKFDIVLIGRVSIGGVFTYSRWSSSILSTIAVPYYAPLVLQQIVLHNYESDAFATMGYGLNHNL
jgi:hypothetical protein